ncbi:MAG: VWA domain-containing protein [Blastocatellia bacterium]|nr:VWA domain-containing protein [Blastocatellia bacterium]
MLWIIRNNRSFQLQTEFYPILVEAANKGYIPKGDLASIVDSVRVGVGQPQLFGTQAKIKDDLIYIQPLLNEEKVDEWRKQYDLPPLNVFIKQLEVRYLMNVLKSPPSALPTLKAKNNTENTEVVSLGIDNEENEVLKIDTKLVNLNVRILNKDLSIPTDLKLSKEDFSVLENGQEQEISFFSTTETPFDLVLLLDFSGSTVEKRSLIKQAAQRFVEVARPNDRIAVVVFTNEIEVISNLTTERSSLIQKFKE